MVIKTRRDTVPMFAGVMTAALFALASCSGTKLYHLYGAVRSPSTILKRIDETGKSMGCTSHVVSALPTRRGKYLNVPVDLSRLPNHVNITFQMDEIYLNLQNVVIANTVQERNELYIEDASTSILLARFPLNFSKSGYRAIKMRGISRKWLANNAAKVGVLKLKLPLAQQGLLQHLANSKSYFVVYAQSALVRPPQCAFHGVMITPQSPLITPSFVTKICSPPQEISFPFNGSTFFDMTAALQRAMNDNPLPQNAAVFRNPKCCHAMKAVSRRFARLFPEEPAIRVEEILNVDITECGCGTA